MTVAVPFIVFSISPFCRPSTRPLEHPPCSKVELRGHCFCTLTRKTALAARSSMDRGRFRAVSQCILVIFCNRWHGMPVCSIFSQEEINVRVPKEPKPSFNPRSCHGHSAAAIPYGAPGSFGLSFTIHAPVSEDAHNPNAGLGREAACTPPNNRIDTRNDQHIALKSSSSSCCRSAR